MYSTLPLPSMFEWRGLLLNRYTVPSSNYILAKFLIEKQNLQHYPRNESQNQCLSLVKTMIDNQAYRSLIVHFTHKCLGVNVEIEA